MKTNMNILRKNNCLTTSFPSKPSNVISWNSNVPKKSTKRIVEFYLKIVEKNNVVDK